MVIYNNIFANKLGMHKVQGHLRDYGEECATRFLECHISEFSISQVVDWAVDDIFI